MLKETVRLFHHYGFKTIVIRDNTTGGGHYEGLKQCSPESFVLFAGDDVQCKDLSNIGIALDRARSGLIVAPRLWRGNGALRHSHLRDGETVWLSEFPFAQVRTMWQAWPWPTTNHFCDSWISEWANQYKRGPIVTNGFEFTHLIETPVTDLEREEYETWKIRRDL
jgi:hypothetical protein